MTIWIALPGDRTEAGTCRVIGRHSKLPLAGQDLLLRFWRWSDASTYLDRLIIRGLLVAGCIESYVPGIGWVLADTDPEETT